MTKIFETIDAIWDACLSMSKEKKDVIVISHRTFMFLGMAILLLWNGYTTSQLPQIIDYIHEIPSIIDMQKRNSEEIREIKALLAKHHIANHDDKPIGGVSYE